MIVKQAVPVNFAQGLDTKTDPKQVQMGKFLQLENMVFNKGGLLQKRNGYAALTSLDSTYKYLTTFNGNLTALGQNIAAYNPGNETFVTKGNTQPLSLSTLPLIRNNYTQIAADSAVSPNGLICTVYRELKINPVNENGFFIGSNFVIADSITGQNIVPPTPIPASGGQIGGGVRVFLLGEYFILIFQNAISSNVHLQYIAINSNNPTSIGANVDIAPVISQISLISYDAIFANERLYVAYNVSSGGQAVKIRYLTTSLVLSSSNEFAGYTASIMSLTADNTMAIPNVYVSFYNGGIAWTGIFDANLNLVMNPAQTLSSGTVDNMTSSAQNGACTVLFEMDNNYSYDSSIETHYIQKVTVFPVGSVFTSVFSSGAATITASSATGLVNGMTIVDNTTSANITSGTTFTISGTTLTLSQNTAGNSQSSPGDALMAATISAASVILRSVGIASKSFIFNGSIYLLTCYNSAYQPTYFLINASLSTSASPVISAKLAYGNASIQVFPTTGAYFGEGVPTASIVGDLIYIPYLFKDLIQAVNKNTNVASGVQTTGVYAQAGINLVAFEIGSQNIDTAEIGSDLHISGGFLWMYDGYLPVEHNFFLWPDSVEAAKQADPAPTGTVTSSSFNITLMSSVAGIGIGMAITGTGIPSNTFVRAILSASSVGMTNAATGSHSAEVITFTGNQSAQQYFYQATYEWADNQGNQFKSAPGIPVTATTTSGNSSVVVNIPTLRLTMKTANPVKICLYRWSVAQQIYYQVTPILGPLLNDTTVDFVSFIDPFSDAQILGNNILYTTGGVVEDVNAPASNILALFDTRLWLVDAEDANLLWFSKQVIEATPVEMSDLFTFYIPPTTSTEQSTGPITALAPMDDKLVIFKKDFALYINGTGPDNTGANNNYSQPIFITATVGCPNQASLVLTPNGLMFQSNKKGIWLLDRGLGTTYIGAPVENFTTNANVTSAVNIPETNQVRFTLDSGITLMYDYYYSQWGTFKGVPAISSCIYQEYHTYLNSIGSIGQETPGMYLDGSNPVLMMFQTGPLRLGELQNYQRAFFFYILATYLSPHKLQINLTYDYESGPSQSIIISPNNYSTPYGSGSFQSPYGQGYPFGGPGNLELWRVFLQRQRCMAFQIQLQEIFDSSFGVPAGAGLSISGLNVVMGFKKGFRPQSAAESVG